MKVIPGIAGICICILAFGYHTVNSETPGGREVSSELAGWWNMEWNDINEEFHFLRNGPRRKARKSPVPLVDTNAFVWDSDRHPADVIIRRTEALIADLESMESTPDLSDYRNELLSLKSEAGEISLNDTSTVSKDLFYRACGLRRTIMFKNPLLDFDSVAVCVSTHIATTKDYANTRIQTMDYGFRPWVSVAKEGGGWFNEYDKFVSLDMDQRVASKGDFKYADWSYGPVIICGIKSESGEPVEKHILQDARPVNGPNAGKLLYKRGPFGGFWDIHFDAGKILFSWSDPVYRAHKVFSSNIDGSDLRQLTSGSMVDCQPVWTPDGRIVFGSTRLLQVNRCSGSNSVPSMSLTLHSMKADGSDMYPISFHETTELSPVVDFDGKILYSRWDYIDRDLKTGHHLWTCYPDGRDPRSSHGNYADDPDGEMYSNHRHNDKYHPDEGNAHIRPIPGEPGKYVAIAPEHHEWRDAAPIIIDTRIPDYYPHSQVTGIVNEPFRHCGYNTPWPLNDRHFLIKKNDNLIILDVYGNEVFLARTKGLTPIPLKKRTMPPVIPQASFSGERYGSEEHKRATLGVLDVMESDFEWPEGTEIKKLRIIGLAVKPWLSPGDVLPAMGMNRTLPRAILGEVPVESDGSAYFEAPVGIEILFQALDQHDRAVVSMRSGTHVMPGEQLTCVGCHEDKWNIPPMTGQRQAFKRAPSGLQPGPEGSLPFSYARLVQPVIAGTCLPCHIEKVENGGPRFAETAYQSWAEMGFWYNEGSNGPKWHEGAVHGWRSEPGNFGFRASRLGQALWTTHKDRITEEEMKRFISWIDGGTGQYGAFHHLEEQDAGEVVWPLTGFDPDNPTKVESHRPLADGTVHAMQTPNGLQVRDRCTAVSVRYDKGLLVVSGVARDMWNVTVHNAAGARVGRIVSGQRGNDHVKFPALASGAYVVILRVNGRRSIHRIMVSR